MSKLTVTWKGGVFRLLPVVFKSCWIKLQYTALGNITHCMLILQTPFERITKPTPQGMLICKQIMDFIISVIIVTL